MARLANSVALARAAAAARPVVEDDGLVAVLGPTNTGKTHYAVERMLAHRTGVIGFPLRLLAREVYDRVCGMRDPREVALITGEEKIFPPDARYVLSTVEAMPLDWGADFLAIDEIQLCADPERGHVFTDRLLHARGRLETLFLGAATMWDRIASLTPKARFISRERFSTLSYSGQKKISRLPARTAIVAFSVDNVYAIAELLRRQKGGAAVVMGALSPRTRNAQVALYQEGDVDYLVATDAIGMGLNMDVRHVAFAGLSKFDGRRIRRLSPAELAQIAGRAGRHANDGTFGVTGAAPTLDEETIEQIEGHRFAPVGRLQWRNAKLDFGSARALVMSLEQDPREEGLARAREADDVAALKRLLDDPHVVDRARGPGAVRRLWDVCQTPDFRKTMATEHAALLSQLYQFLVSDAGVVPEAWMERSVARVDRTDGDIDTLSKRLAYVRTWTYVANRSDWLADPAYWRGVTRDIEDKLSDALHAGLTQRFVDRRTSVLARRLKEKEKLVATISPDGSVSVEGEFVGKLQGFRFEPDPTAAGAEVKTLQAASAQALQAELARRVERFYNSPDGEIDVTEQGGVMWGDAAVGRLESRAAEGGDPLSLKAVAFADDLLEAAQRERIERRIQAWIDRKIEAAFEPLIKLRDDETVTGLARGVAFQLLENRGVIPRHEIASEIRALEQTDRATLRKHGVRFGQYTVFLPALLKPAPTRFRLLLWGLAEGLDEIPSPPPPGHVTITADPDAPARIYAMSGYRACGQRALRLDMLERLADLIRPLDVKEGFEATPEMLSITGSTLDQFAEMMEGLGYRAERGERPKTAKPQPVKTAPGKRKGKKGAEQPAEAAQIGAAALEAAVDGGAEAAPSVRPVIVFDMPAAGAAASDDAVRGSGDQDAETAVQADAEPIAEAPAHTADMSENLAATEAAEPVTASREAPEKPAEGAAPDAAAEPSLAVESAAEGTSEKSASQHSQAEAAPNEGASVSEAPAVGETSAEAAAVEPPPVEAAAPEATTDAATSSDPETVETGEKPAEMEVFYVFRQAPRPRRARNEERGPRRDGARGGQRRDPAEAGEGGPRRREGGGRGQRHGQGQGHGQGHGNGRGDGPRREDGGGQRREGGEGRGGPRRRRGGGDDAADRPRREGGQGGGFRGENAARAEQGGRGDRPPRGEQKGRGDKGQKGGRDRQPDPDSPFAVLQQLKSKL